MVRWGLGICAVGFTVMLLIPMPLRPGGNGRAETPVRQTVEKPSQSLSPVAPPRAGASLMSLPDAAPDEVPTPAMPAIESIAATVAPVLLPTSAQQPPDDKAGRVLALSVRPARTPPEVYRVAAAGAVLRAGPSALERNLAELAAGERVEVLSRFADRWFFVRLADGSTEGYLDATLLSPAD